MMTNNIIQLSPALRIPDELKRHRAWLVWKFINRPGRKKPLKVPYYVNGQVRRGQQGTEHDVAMLESFEVAYSAYRAGKWDGVGFATLKQFGIVALDFDACFTSGVLAPEIEELVSDTYCEESPSGTGVRAFYTGSLPNKKTLASANLWGFETFNSAGFVTVTGKTLPICSLLGNENFIAPVSTGVEALFTERFGEERSADRMQDKSVLGLGKEKLSIALSKIDPKGVSYADWCNVGFACHHESSGEYWGLEAWDEWSQGDEARYVDYHDLEDRWRGFSANKDKLITARFLLKLGNVADISEFDDLDATPAHERFKLWRVSELGGRPAPTWLIKGVVPKAALGVVYGESGSGKSFFILDMVMCIARGIEWRGRRVKRGKVAYICAEGQGGFTNRVAAYMRQHKLSAEEVDDFRIIFDRPNFLQADHVAIIKRLQADGGADIVVVDTFAQVTPGGNENAAEDVGKALSHCHKIHEATGAIVVLVHHAGKDLSKGARGWSGIKAAADFEIEISRTADYRQGRLSKSKDGEDGIEWPFKLDSLVLSMDEDGDEITSCVVAETVKVDKPKGSSMGSIEEEVYNTLSDMAGMTGRVKVDELIDEAARRLPKKEKGRDRRREYARQALSTLHDRRLVNISEDDDTVETGNGDANA